MLVFFGGSMKRRFKVGDHPKVIAIDEWTSVVDGGPTGSGAFGCRMQRCTVHTTVLVCVSGHCGARGSEQFLKTLPHSPKQ